MTPRRLALILADTPADGTAHPATVDEESANAPEAPPSPASGVLLTVPPYLVEAGDLLVDWPHARVGSLLSDGCSWWFYDADGVLICTPQPGDTDIQVVRVGEGAVNGRPTAEIVADLREWGCNEELIHGEAADRLTELDALLRDIAVWEDWKYDESDRDNGKRLGRAAKAAIATWKAMQ